MAISFRNSAKNSAGSATSVSVNVPSGVVNGDLMLALVSVSGGSATSITAPSGWTLIGTKTDTGSGAGNEGEAVYYRLASSEPASYTWQCSPAATINVIHAAWTGTDQGLPVSTVTAATTTASSNNVNAPSVTPDLNDCLLVCCFAIAVQATWTPPAGMTPRDSNGPVGGPSILVAELQLSGASATGTKTATAAGTANNSGRSVLLVPGLGNDLLSNSRRHHRKAWRFTRRRPAKRKMPRGMATVLLSGYAPARGVGATATLIVLETFQAAAVVEEADQADAVITETFTATAVVVLGGH